VARVLQWVFRNRKHRKSVVEAEKEARLEDAQRTLDDLKDRKDRAIRLLGERQSRNHWSESIDIMIRGAR
jgi:hypothetical protein